MAGKTIELPEGELRRIFDTIDAELERRKKGQRPADETKELAAAWQMIADLRAFCELLAVAIGQEGVAYLETVATKANVTTPARMIVRVYLGIPEELRPKRVVLPKWADKAVLGDNGQTGGGTA